MGSLILAGVLLAQIVTHLAWLPISAHSGQVAIPWMMNQGRTMFDNLLEQHAPATSVIAALAMRLTNADPVLVTRMLNLIVILALTLLVFGIARHFGGTLAGVIAGLIWFWWEPVYGNILFYFDTVVGLVVALALWLWLVLEKRQRQWIAPLVVGLLLGGATLAKQHAWAAVALFGLWLLIYERRRLPAYIAGALVLPILMILLIAAQGNLQTYLYWNWIYNLSGMMKPIPPTGDFFRKVVLSNAFVPIFLLLALRHDKWWWLILLLWLAAAADYVPDFGEIHAMTQLPFACVIGGVVLAIFWPELKSLRRLASAPAANVALAGLVIAGLVGWLWTGAAPYFSAPLGRAGIPAYDEFKPLVAALKPINQPGDTLFVLPETDSTPQLHVMTGLLPPGLWIKGWAWYFKAPNITNRLLTEWGAQPPTDIIYFPDLIPSGQPGIDPLVAFMKAHYHAVETVPNIVFHGDAMIYRWNGG